MFYLYKSYCDGLAYGEEYIRLFENKNDAKILLAKHVKEAYGESPDKLRLLPDFKHDLITDEYVSITNDGGDTSYFIIESIEVTPSSGNNTKNFTNTVYDAEINATIIKDPDPETPFSIQGNTVRVDWYRAGEGYWGDYDPENPEDHELLRFDCYIKRDNEWAEVDDASYCTLVRVDDPEAIQIKKLKAIYKEYNNILAVDPDTSVKKLGEALSWI